MKAREWLSMSPVVISLKIILYCKNIDKMKSVSYVSSPCLHCYKQLEIRKDIIERDNVIVMSENHLKGTCVPHCNPV